MSNDPNGIASGPDPTSDDVRHASIHRPTRKIYFSSPEGFSEMTDEEQESWADEVATRFEEEVARNRDEAGDE